MISLRSLYQFAAVIVVDLIAWPINRAIDAIDFSDIGDDEHDVLDELPLDERIRNGL